MKVFFLYTPIREMTTTMSIGTAPEVPLGLKGFKQKKRKPRPRNKR